MNEGFWRWLLKVIRDGYKTITGLRWVKEPIIESLAGYTVIILGIVLPILVYLYWLIPIFAVGGLLIMAHASWRQAKGRNV